MGKKGGWFSSIKRVFTPNSKHKPAIANDSEKNEKKKKKGDTNSFIPLFRKPSSIEKIFGDFEREQQQQQHNSRPKPSSFATPRATSPRAASPRAPESTQTPKPSSFATPRATSPHAASPRAPESTQAPKPSSFATPRAPTPPRVLSPPRNNPRKEISHRPESSLRHHHASAATRIQTAYRGFAARRSFRALKGLVRLQGVVRGQNVKRQTANAMKYMQLVVRVQSQIQARRIQMSEAQARRQDANNRKWNLSEGGSHGDWDDSVLTKEQVDVRMQKKVEAIIKRERAMAYAYSNQLWKSSPNSAQTTGGGGFPWWYNWLDRQLPSDQRPMTPPIMDTQTPRSFKSTRMARTPLSSHLRPPRGAREFEFPTNDDQSLTSCPPFSVPNYMAATASAKAKVRANSNPKERLMGSTDSKRRLSFPLWSKASNSVYSGNNTPAISVTNFSVDSTVSLPAAIPVSGRKPFNRFV